MVERPISPFRRRLDRAGIALSGLCALHCVVSIMIVAGLGAGLGIGGELFLNPDIHRIGLVFAVLIAAVATAVSRMKCRRVTSLIVLCFLALLARLWFRVILVQFHVNLCGRT